MAADDGSRPPPGGTVGDHPPRPRLPLFVAPSTGAQFNTARMPLPPLACWRLEDVRFEFDASLVRADAAPEFTLLARAHVRMGKPALSIFGHADPTGDDEYNKTLSGRRAQAIYGLLTRRADLWEDLYSHPFGGDDWRPGAASLMVTALGFGSVKSYQAARGLTADNVAGPNTRAKLFLEYMDAICRDDSGQPFSVTPAEFLARGADPQGKGDYQGCSEFNPILVFSRAQADAFAQPSRKPERDQQNAPNRRVLVFLFSPGLTVDASLWPCPRVKENSSGCRKMFWPDADVRRNPQGQRREYAKTKDTFACAFYDAMAHVSPCERVRTTLELRLLDATQTVMERAVYRVTSSSQDARQGTADSAGRVREDNLLAGSTVHVEWGFAGDGDPLPFSASIFLDFASDGDASRAITARLSNLGYRHDDQAVNIRMFQHDYGLNPEDGELRGDTRTAIETVHDQRLSREEFAALQGQGQGQG